MEIDSEQRQQILDGIKRMTENARQQFSKHERTCKQCRPQGMMRMVESMCEQGRSLWRTYAKFTDGPIELVRYVPTEEK